MTLIVDASVAAKWFARENLHGEALSLLTDGEELRAPDFIVPEVVNIAWKKHLRGEFTKVQADAVAIAVPRYFHALYPSIDLAVRALEMAISLEHPVYDCLYLACAELESTLVVTADTRFFTAAQGSEFATLIGYLGAPPFRLVH